MIVKKKLKIITYMTLFSLALSACGDIKKKPAPELLEPVTITESFRPVEYGDVGEINVENGIIVPEEQCYFWTTPVYIKEIVVDIGQYVNEGDVLAYADTEQASYVLTNLQNELANINANYEQDQAIYELKHKELEYVLQGAKERGLVDEIAKSETNLEILEENNRYDKMLHDYRVRQKNTSISKQAEIVSDGKLVAKKPGYVSYIKDLSENGYATSSDNIVVVADYNNAYIEAPNIELSEQNMNLLKGYNRFYTEISGVRYDLTEIKYAPEELVATENKSMYPYMRFNIEDKSKLPEIGSSVPIFFSKDVIEDVLIVGNDSVFDDEQGKFVYVKDGDNKEIRHVELGKKGENYSEIISGLSEGELVYYSSGALLPEQYEERVVKGTEYSISSGTKSYTRKESVVNSYFSECEGIITELTISPGFTVNKGDLLCTIKTNDGSARLAEMANNITNLKQNNEKTIKQLDEQIDNLEKILAAIDEVPSGETEATPTDATPTDATNEDSDPYLYNELELQVKQLRCMKQKENINFSYRLNLMQTEYNKVSCNNDGKGYVNIYAKTDGIVSDISISKGKLIKVDQYMFNILDPDSEKLAMKLGDSGIRLNQKVKFVFDDDENIYYTGRVIGMTKSDKPYVTTDGDDIYVTKSNSYKDYVYYYVEVDDEAYANINTAYTAKYSVKTINDAVVVDAPMVTEEKVEKETYYYLWRVVDGILVKQYVDIIQEMTPVNKYCIVSGLKIGDILAVESE